MSSASEGLRHMWTRVRNIFKMPPCVCSGHPWSRRREGYGIFLTAPTENDLSDIFTRDALQTTKIHSTSKNSTFGNR
ncbi:hypothetical protein TcasGA2_TC032894 [Tribolium castaneum]|uniref:Uncharacterized protein n=1 Tax=Tribolium castaneum TaxID=7070 RepID=A0A139WJN8_TRICA|nr:hypothetical protein TcasGA2_TC032894 [Tribolium castaneum]